MESLNSSSTKALCKIVDAMNGKQHLKIENGIYLPLTIELIGEGISTPFGQAKLYSFCHYYEKNGDLMQAPEMCFIQVDNRSAESDNWEKVVVLPYMFQDAASCSYELSIIIENQKLVRVIKSLQKRHISLGNQFMYLIDSLNYLKFIGNGNTI